jgi:hypothetical protein
MTSGLMAASRAGFEGGGIFIVVLLVFLLVSQPWRALRAKMGGRPQES